MTVPRWGGRLVGRCRALVLLHKGTICHLCDLPGADSPDHDPPRSVLIRQGVPNPDDLDYLWPSHVGCNVLRNDRPLTPEVRAECRAHRLRFLGLDAPPSDLSPTLARRRPVFEPEPSSRKACCPVSPPDPTEKTAEEARP